MSKCIHSEVMDLPSPVQRVTDSKHRAENNKRCDFQGLSELPFLVRPKNIPSSHAVIKKISNCLDAKPKPSENWKTKKFPSANETRCFINDTNYVRACLAAACLLRG